MCDESSTVRVVALSQQHRHTARAALAEAVEPTGLAVVVWREVNMLEGGAMGLQLVYQLRTRPWEGLS